jgi:hypothetical protein
MWQRRSCYLSREERSRSWAAAPGRSGTRGGPRRASVQEQPAMDLDERRTRPDMQSLRMKAVEV